MTISEIIKLIHAFNVDMVWGCSYEINFQIYGMYLHSAKVLTTQVIASNYKGTIIIKIIVLEIITKDYLQLIIFVDNLFAN